MEVRAGQHLCISDPIPLVDWTGVARRTGVKRPSRGRITVAGFVAKAAGAICSELQFVQFHDVWYCSIQVRRRRRERIFRWKLASSPPDFNIKRSIQLRAISANVLTAFIA